MASVVGLWMEAEMPTYEYVCTSCGTPLEVVQSIHDPALTQCPNCEGGRLRKVFGNVGVVFKGSGFYRTDNRGKSAAAPAAKDAAATASDAASGAKDGAASAVKDTGSSASSGGSAGGSGKAAAAAPAATPTSS